MKLSALMVINTIVCLVFGVAFAVIPWQVFALYGVEPSLQLNYMGQLFGAALLAFAILTWSARKADDSDARKAILLALFIGDVIGLVVALLGQFSGVVNAMGWSTVVIYLLLAIGFGYFRFAKSSA